MAENGGNEHDEKKSPSIEKGTSASDTKTSHRRKTTAKQLLIAVMIWLAVVSALFSGFIYILLKLNPWSASR